MPRKGMYHGSSTTPHPSFYGGDVVEITKGKYSGMEGFVKGIHRKRHSYKKVSSTGEVTKAFGKSGSTGTYDVYLPELDKVVVFKVGNLELSEPAFGPGDPRLRHPYSKAGAAREAAGIPEYSEWDTFRLSKRGTFSSPSGDPDTLRLKAQELREFARRFKAPEAYAEASNLAYRADLLERGEDF